MMEAPIKVYGGLSMVMAPGDNQICRQLGQGLEWEPDTSRIIRQALRPGDTFIDAGANIGWFSILASRCVGPIGRVLAFEPWKSNYDILRENLGLNGCLHNVSTFNFPLWSSPAKLYVWLGDQSNCGDVRTRLAKPEEVGVPDLNIMDAHPIDEFVQPNTVRFVKVDCQESDMEVIKGGKKLFTGSEKIGLVVEDPHVPDSIFGLHRVGPTADWNQYYEK